MDIESELIEAIREGNIEAVEFLLCPDVYQASGDRSQCADINARNGEALVTAVENEDLKMVEYLLSRGADIHASSVTSFSSVRERPLQAAVETGNLEIIEYLLSKGADPNEAVSYYEREYGGEDSYDILTRAEDLQTMALLLSYGTDPNLLFSSAYIAAIERGDLKKVKLLHAYGVRSSDYDLVRAAEKGRINVMRYLISQGKDPSRWYQGENAYNVYGPRRQAVIELLTESFSLPGLKARNEQELLNLSRIRELMPGSLGVLIAKYL